MSRRSLYLALAVAGAVVPWVFFYQFFVHDKSHGRTWRPIS